MPASSTMPNELLAVPEIDNIIFQNVSWEELVRLHNDAKASKEITVQGLPMNVVDVLMYLRALSRILINAAIQQRKAKTSLGPLYSIAAGSTNHTSDYDVTLVGEEAAKVCEYIIKSFYLSTGRTLAHVVDSNVYIAPAFVIKEGVTYPKWFTYTLIPGTKDQAFPVPQSSLAIQAEIHTVLEREKQLKTKDTRTVIEKYESMIARGKELEDRFYYPKDKNVKGSEKEFWGLLHSICMDAMEAYVTLSTILSVVVEMQMKTPLSDLTEIHYLISAFENMINFIDHNHGIELSNDGLLLKNSKYIYRIVNCLSKVEKYKELMGVDLKNIEYIVSQRGSPSDIVFGSPQFSRFREDVTKLFGLYDVIKKDLMVRVSSTSRKVKNNTRKRKIRRNRTRKV
jgi:hypothetical protein